MPAGKDGRYHHGDLRTALVGAATDVIASTGVRDFSMAAASRRLGVAPSAPYAHFADRGALLAAVAVRACEVFHAELTAQLRPPAPAAARLAGLAACYVRFAGTYQPLFEVLFMAGVDKREHPEVAEAERPLDEALQACVREVTGGLEPASDDLATAVEATAHGHAMLLLDGGFGDGPAATETAARRAEAATLALIEGRGQLSR